MGRKDIADTLAAWDAAEQTQDSAVRGSNDERTAARATRRAKWAYEDAIRDAAEGLGMSESLQHRAERMVLRGEVLASERYRSRHARQPETDDARKARLRDERIIQEELGAG